MATYVYASSERTSLGPISFHIPKGIHSKKPSDLVCRMGTLFVPIFCVPTVGFFHLIILVRVSESLTAETLARQYITPTPIQRNDQTHPASSHSPALYVRHTPQIKGYIGFNLVRCKKNPPKLFV